MNLLLYLLTSTGILKNLFEAEDNNLLLYRHVVPMGSSMDLADKRHTNNRPYHCKTKL